MNKDDYIGASISTRIYEKNLLTRAQLERLNEADSIKEVLNQLNDTIYRDAIDSLANPYEYEKILKAELKRVYKLIEDLSPDTNTVKYMREKYHFHNLKVMVKEVIQDTDYSNLYLDMGGLDLDFIKKNLIKEDSKDSFALESRDKDLKTKPKRYYEQIYLSFGKEALDKFNESQNPQDIDLFLDKAYFKLKLEDSKNLALEKLTELTKDLIDLTNLKILLRIKSQDESVKLVEDSLIDGGFIDKDKFKELFSYDLNRLSTYIEKTRLSNILKGLIKENRDLDEIILDIERVIDDYMTDFTIDSKLVTFGPEVLLNFLISKETEIKNLRILLISKQNKLDKELTLERLRKSYV